jgi:hypothetical protein
MTIETNLETPEVQSAPSNPVEAIEKCVKVKHQQVIYGIPREQFIQCIEKMLGTSFERDYELMNVDVKDGSESYVDIALVEKTTLRKLRAAQLNMPGGNGVPQIRR